MEQTNSDGEIKISKYNSAIAQLYRMDELWKDAHKHSRAGDLRSWNWDLDRVWCELAADAKKEDKDTFNNFIIKISDNARKKGGSNMFYHILLEKEIFLRTLQNTQGKGTAYADEFEDDFD